MRRIAACVSALALLAAPVPAGGIKGPVILLDFVSFTAAGMVEQDVFVADGADAVRRVPFAEVAALQDAALFGTTAPPPFEPLNLAPDARYPRGRELNLTLGEWLGASGKGRYMCMDDGTATVEIAFAGLVPGGVYTMWNFIDAEPPTDPWQTIMFPLGARDGSQATFHADAKGDAAYSASFEPCLELTGTQTLTGLAAAWHADGKTWGALPGDLGVVTFAQLMVPLILDEPGSSG